MSVINIRYCIPMVWEVPMVHVRWFGKFASRMPGKVSEKWKDSQTLESAEKLREVNRFRETQKTSTTMKDEKPQIQDIDGDLEKARGELYKLGWSESGYVREPPPQPEYDSFTGVMSITSREELAIYYKRQQYLWSRKEKRKLELDGKTKSLMRRNIQEKKRVIARNQPVRFLPSPFRIKDREKLTASLNVFRSHVNRFLPDSAMSQNEGWPPRDAKFIGRVRHGLASGLGKRIPPYGRELYMYNQRTSNGERRVPILVICIRKTPVLFLRKKEMLTLQQCLPQLREIAENIKKRTGETLL